MPRTTLRDGRTLEWSDLGDPDDVALARRWLAALPDEEPALVDGPVATWPPPRATRSWCRTGYLSDAALVFAGWPFRVEEVTCPLDLWWERLLAGCSARLREVP